MDGTKVEVYNAFNSNSINSSSRFDDQLTSYQNSMADHMLNNMHSPASVGMPSGNMNVNNNESLPPNQSPFSIPNHSVGENIQNNSPSMMSAVTQKDTRQQSPASSAGMESYSMHVNSPMDAARGGGGSNNSGGTPRNDMLQSSPNAQRDKSVDNNMSPSAVSSVGSNPNENILNSPTNLQGNSSRHEQIPNSPTAMSQTPVGSNSEQQIPTDYQNNVNPTPQLPPYSGGYFQNILASYHGYRSNLPQSPGAAQQDMDKTTAANIANIAKSVVQGNLTSPPPPGQAPEGGRKVRDKPFQCTLCHKRYTNRAGLTVHILSHTGERPHACTLCDKRFTQKSALDQHMLIHTGQRPYECKICFKTFTQKANLNAHMMIHNGDKPYQCRICDKRFTQRSNLNTHILTHSDLEKMQAVAAMGQASMGVPADMTSSLPFPIGPTHTNESFQKYNPTAGGSTPSTGNSHRSEMDAHRQSIEFLKSQFDLNVRNNAGGVGEKMEQGDREKLQKDFDQIKQTMDNNPPFSPTSQDMNARFKTEDQATHSNQAATLSNMTPFQNETFQNILANIRNSFVGNVRSHSKPTDNKERPFQCMFCEKRFTQRAGLNAHVLIHSGQRPHPCSICDKRFTQKSGLDQHMLTHTGERPHQCHLCEKRFTQKANLNHHILTHTGEKRHVCPFCDRRFTQKANLNAHILTHTGEKPHQCMVCERRFTQKSGLNQHILTHTGEKPYQCKLCDKAYTQKSGLDVHMYSHSGQKPYRCQFCDKQFVARTLWAKHLRSSHGHEEPPPMNAYGRGGHGGMNLIRSASLPGGIGAGNDSATSGAGANVKGVGGLPPLPFDLLKNMPPDLFKQPPSDCYKLLNDSYNNATGGASGATNNNKQASNVPPFNNRTEQPMDTDTNYDTNQSRNERVENKVNDAENNSDSLRHDRDGPKSGLSINEANHTQRVSDQFRRSGGGDNSEDLNDVNMTSPMASTTGSEASYKLPGPFENFRSMNNYSSKIPNYKQNDSLMSPASGERDTPMSSSESLRENYKSPMSLNKAMFAADRQGGAYQSSGSFDALAERSVRPHTEFENPVAGAGGLFVDENQPRATDPEQFKSQADRYLAAMRDQYAAKVNMKQRSMSDSYAQSKPQDIGRYGNQDQDTANQNGYNNKGGGANLDMEALPGVSQSVHSQAQVDHALRLQQAFVGAGPAVAPPPIGPLNDGGNPAAMFGNPHHHRMGNMYQERFINIYRDMITTNYPQDPPPAFT